MTRENMGVALQRLVHDEEFRNQFVFRRPSLSPSAKEFERSPNAYICAVSGVLNSETATCLNGVSRDVIYSENDPEENEC